MRVKLSTNVIGGILSGALLVSSLTAEPGVSERHQVNAQPAVTVTEEAPSHDAQNDWQVWDDRMYKSKDSCLNFARYYLMPNYPDIQQYRCRNRWRLWVFPPKYGMMLEVIRS